MTDENSIGCSIDRCGYRCSPDTSASNPAGDTGWVRLLKQWEGE
jgi:hypothetical protein